MLNLPDNVQFILTGSRAYDHAYPESNIYCAFVAYELKEKSNMLGIGNVKIIHIKQDYYGIQLIHTNIITLNLLNLILRLEKYPFTIKFKTTYLNNFQQILS